MNREYARTLLPLLTAYAEGKTIQYSNGGKWYDASSPAFNEPLSLYRVKPEPVTRYMFIYRNGDVSSSYKSLETCRRATPSPSSYIIKVSTTVEDGTVETSVVEHNQCGR